MGEVFISTAEIAHTTHQYHDPVNRSPGSHRVGPVVAHEESRPPLLPRSQEHRHCCYNPMWALHLRGALTGQRGRQCGTPRHQAWRPRRAHPRADTGLVWSAAMLASWQLGARCGIPIRRLRGFAKPHSPVPLFLVLSFLKTLYIPTIQAYWAN